MEATDVWFAGLCCVCLRDADRLCRQCGVAAYCCWAHGAVHWPQHARLCAALRRQGARPYGDPSEQLDNGDRWREVRARVLRRCERALSRACTPPERALILYPRACSTCHAVQGLGVTTLNVCSACRQHWHCRPEHARPEHHSRWCARLRLHVQLARRARDLRLDVQPSGADCGRPLPLRPDVTACVRAALRLHEDGEEDADGDLLRLCVLSQAASGPLTVARALLDGSAASYQDYDDGELRVDLVGAEMRYEGAWPPAWEYFLLHFLPARVRRLVVCMVGPELGGDEDGESSIEREVDVCDECRVVDRRVTLRCERGLLYHEYVASERYSPPHLVAALNAGLHRAAMSTWPPTIRAALARPSTPFLVTAYTRHEAPLDLLRVRSCVSNRPLHVLRAPQRNPYASLKPERNFISDQEQPLIFKNYYVILLAT